PLQGVPPSRGGVCKTCRRNAIHVRAALLPHFSGSGPRRAARTRGRIQFLRGEPGRTHMLVVRHAAQLVCVARSGERCKRGAAMRSLEIVADGAIVVNDGRIDWVGATADLPPLPADAEILDASGKVVLPGWVDSHTHLLFAG